MVTAVGGGAVRDVVLRRVPGVLGGNTLYATPALAAAGTVVLITQAGRTTWGSVAGLVVGAGLCLLARWRGWILPSADAWSAAMAPSRYRNRLRQRVHHRTRRGLSGSPLSTQRDDTPHPPDAKDTS
jgi:hypothetical protein